MALKHGNGVSLNGSAERRRGTSSFIHRSVSVLSWKLFLFLLPLFAWMVFAPTRSMPLSAGPYPPSRPSTDLICSKPPFDSCAFYSSCLELRYNCGPKGYPLAYGEHFCEKFSENRSTFSVEGNEWMLNVMHCLQTALVPEAVGIEGTNCEALKRKAFQSHPRCYLDSGVCRLGLGDWKAIVDVVGWKTLFGSFDAFKASVEAATGCAEYALLSLIRKMPLR